MTATHSTSETELHPLLGGGISVAFWMCLGVSALLFATVVAAPRITEWKRLERRFLQSSEQIHALKADIKHLKMLRDAIKNDPEFAARVVHDELNLQPTRGQRVDVDASLGYDPRERRSTVSKSTLDQAWYEPLLADLSNPTLLRKRWLIGTGLLCLLSFVFLQEGIFRGRMGSGLVRGLQHMLRRYESTPLVGGIEGAAASSQDATGEALRS